MAAYTAKTKPGSPSPARALAYSEGSPLPGPSADPDGWHTLPPSKVLGTVNRKSVDVTYTVSRQSHQLAESILTSSKLSLAKPVRPKYTDLSLSD